MSLTFKNIIYLVIILGFRFSLAADLAPNIIGGSLVSPDETVGQVTVGVTSSRGRVFCTGVVIGPDTVLTAAHCQAARKIAFTTAILPQSTFRNVTAITVHPQYLLGNPASLDPKDVLPMVRNDLAVLHFSGGLPASHRVALLPEVNARPRAGQSLIAAGYGLNETGYVDGKLRKLKFKASLGQPYAPGMIDQYFKFFVPSTSTQAPCVGDSGGPALSGNVVMGISSHRMVEDKSYACECRALVYTNVGDYVAWIRSVQ